MLPQRGLGLHYVNMFLKMNILIINDMESFVLRNRIISNWDEKICRKGKAAVRNGQGTTDWLQIGKGGRQGCILSPCLFNFHAEYIMRNAGLEEAQAGIKIARRNINNLRYADDSTLMAESEEELKSLLIKVNEKWKSWLKAQHS